MDASKITMTVMAVDDNPANLKLIGALLEGSPARRLCVIADIERWIGRNKCSLI